MKSAFVIVNYNDSKTTLELIDNIKNYQIDKIVIVDNASSDNSYEVLKKIENDKIVVLKNTSNKGYGAGINLGAKYLKNLYKECNIIVSNPDIIIEKEKDLIHLLDKMNNNYVSIISPVIKEKGSLNRGWKIPTPTIDALMNLPVIHKVLNKHLLLYKESHYNSDLVSVEVVSGSFFIIKLSVLEKIDYFDENIFLYYEENVIASKLKKLNLKTYIDTKVSVIHNHSVTINKSIKRLNKFKILKKSQIYFEYTYNKPNIFEKLLLKTTYYISLLVQELIYVIESK